MKNILIGLSVIVVVLGSALVWQGALKDAVETRSQLGKKSRELAVAREEIEKRKEVWRLLYSQVGSGATVSMRKFSNFDSDPQNHPFVIDVPQKGKYVVDPSGLSFKR